MSRPRRSTGAAWGATALALLLAAAWTVPPLAAAAPPAPEMDEESASATSQAAKKFKRRQARPISLGTSGGNENDFRINLPFIECCSGTLGALVEKQGELYVLSNNHVLARSNEARRGERVSQNGMLDSRCDVPEQNIIGELGPYKKIKFKGMNKVDAALASVYPGMVKENGKILKLGIPGNGVVEPELGARVQKSGRTTGYRKGSVVDVDVVVEVGYTRECGEDDLRFARFNNQFVVRGLNKDFSSGGDSGAVIYEDVRKCPSAMGLLFAGSGEFTLASPMSSVLAQLKKVRPRGAVTLVGCDKPAAAATESLPFTASALAAPPPLEREMREAKRARQLAERQLIELDGIEGMGVGRDAENGTPVVRVYLATGDEELAARVPAQIGGVPVETVVTGRFLAFDSACSAAPHDG